MASFIPSQIPYANIVVYFPLKYFMSAKRECYNFCFKENKSKNKLLHLSRLKKIKAKISFYIYD